MAIGVYHMLAIRMIHAVHVPEIPGTVGMLHQRVIVLQAIATLGGEHRIRR